MAIAMKDLEIRGAGNLLGGEQSGHIADVGFDLYVRLVGEAVSEFRQSAGGTAPETTFEVRIEIPVDAHLPHTYVPSDRLRLEMYKRLAEVQTSEDVTEIHAELSDRYGIAPDPVLRLLDVARLRARMRHIGLAELTLAGSMVRFAAVKLPESRQVRLKRLYPKGLWRPATDTLLIPKPVRRDADLLAFVNEVIDQLIDPATP